VFHITLQDMEVNLHSFLTRVLDVSELVVSFTLMLHYPRTLWVGGDCVGCRDGLDTIVESPCPCREPNHNCPVRRLSYSCS